MMIIQSLLIERQKLCTWRTDHIGIQATVWFNPEPQEGVTVLIHGVGCSQAVNSQTLVLYNSFKKNYKQDMQYFVIKAIFFILF